MSDTPPTPARDEFINIEEEMQRDYIDYSMSVIIGRALPDARDGLKPVNRRILFAMHQGGWSSAKPFVKCARVVGDVMGKYHPHGNLAIYDALVRMAQDFAMRAPLIKSQGNFGSIDGDPPAAERYTECKLNKLAEDLLADIDKDTVDMRLNYDESQEEPSVLPARLPNLLLNGSTGIAVGMATNIPPHNLRELVDGLVHLIDHPEATPRDLMAFIKGPDFPTGATVRGVNEIIKMYETGRGLIRMRGTAEIEEDARGREVIVVTALPYALNKASWVARVAELVNEKRIEGISDIRDESSKEGIRVVIEVKRNAMASVVLNNLYGHTALESTFGATLLAIDKGRPRVLNLRELLVCFLDHRFEVLTRRTRHDLAKAEARAHILEGLLKALDVLDEIVRLIRASNSKDEADRGLQERFGFSALQSAAILEMRLYQLTALERDKVQAEYDEVLARIAYFRDLLAHPEKIYGVIRTDLLQAREQYGTDRLTSLVADDSEVSLEDLIADKPCVITLTHGGYVNRMPLEAYREQRRGGKGVSAMATKEEDYVEHVYTATTHDTLLVFTRQGRVYWKKVYEIPESPRTSRGKAIVNIINLQPGEKIASVLRIREFAEDRFVVFATQRGTVKKTCLADYRNVRADGIIAIGIDEGDMLIDVKLTRVGEEVVLVTRQGQAVRFREDQVRDMGRSAYGVRGVTLEPENDGVVGLAVVEPGGELLCISERGYGKRTPFDEYPLRNRGGKGVITIDTGERNGPVVAAHAVTEGDALMLITEQGQIIRFPVEQARLTGRAAQGVRLVNLDEGDRVMSAAPVDHEVVAMERAEAALAEGAPAPDAPEAPPPSEPPPSA
jgi:DNA gyrase subunit A